MLRINVFFIHLLLLVTVKSQDVNKNEDIEYAQTIEGNNYTLFENASDTNGTDYQSPKDGNCCSATSLIFKFFSLIVGGLIVFTLVYLLIQCCHDNNNISFARVRINRSPPCAIFMENFQSKSNLIPNEKMTKYVLPYDDTLEYIDTEPLHGQDFPLMSPLSKSDKK